MKNLSLKNIITACGGTFYGDEGALLLEVSAIVRDNRHVTSGALFAAIKGEKVDGHDFAAAAIADGALCILAQRRPEGFEGNIILVPNTQTALREIAKFYRQGFDIPIIGITGSVGKTTVKEMLSAVLSQRFVVHKTAGNLNNELGVPLTLFGLEASHTAAVIEMGISDFGEMRRLGEMVCPSHAVITNIGSAHLERLGDKQGVLKAKSEILENLAPDGKVFINGDDPLLMGLEASHEKVTFGLSQSCDVRAFNVRTNEDGTTACTIRCAGWEEEIKIPAYGDHMVYAVLSAWAVAAQLGLSADEIKNGILSYEPMSGRSRVLKRGSITIIDDCYNANPTSVMAAMRSLSRLPGRHICILGDMNELGEASAELHFETGTFARASGAALVLLTGEMSRSTARGAGDVAIFFEDRAQLIKSLENTINPGDTVLVKASHSCAFEEIVSALLSLEL